MHILEITVLKEERNSNSLFSHLMLTLLVTDGYNDDNDDGVGCCGARVVLKILVDGVILQMEQRNISYD